jgi:hypothetical protein
MERRRYLAALGGAGLAAVAGCSAVRDSRMLSEPTVSEEAPTRKSLQFTAGDRDVGSFGVDATADEGSIRLDTELVHDGGTSVESIELGVWLPPADEPSTTEVAVVTPVTGDSSPPPELTLDWREGGGALVTVRDLDDLADETISTLALRVVPGPDREATLVVEPVIELAEGGALGTDYTLDGELELAVPDPVDG